MTHKSPFLKQCENENSSREERDFAYAVNQFFQNSPDSQSGLLDLGRIQLFQLISKKSPKEARKTFLVLHDLYDQRFVQNEGVQMIEYVALQKYLRELWIKN